MNILYAYRYGIVGGVSTQLLLRQAALVEAGVGCRLFFSQDNGLRNTLPKCAQVHFGSDITLSQLVRGERPQIVVVVDSPELLSPASGSLFHRPKVFLDVHTTTKRGLAYLSEISAARLEKVLVPTNHSATIVRSRLASADVRVIPNILDTAAFRPAIRPVAGVHRREFVWVGKLDNHKGWRLALIYARMLREILEDVQLTMVGGYTAPEARAEEFFQLAYQLGVMDIVRWLDQVDNVALASLYQRCSGTGGAMLVTSKDESFGMAAAEALLCGCPLIANDLPVFREIFPKSKLLQLVDIWRPEEVAKALRRLDEAAGSQADALVSHKNLASRFGPGVFVAQFLTMVGGYVNA